MKQLFFLSLTMLGLPFLQAAQVIDISGQPQAALDLDLFQSLNAFAVKMKAETLKIDYFATSLPKLLVFDEDIQARHEADAQHVIDLAHAGLDRHRQPS